MLASILIIVACSALFLYWFRYTCLLILSQRSSGDYALKVASTIRLSFPQASEALQAEPKTHALDRVHHGFENDYRILTDLLQQVGTDDSIERRLLTIDYKVMQVCFRITRAHNRLLARQALVEMSCILGYFAGELGQGAAA